MNTDAHTTCLSLALSLSRSLALSLSPPSPSPSPSLCRTGADAVREEPGDGGDPDRRQHCLRSTEGVLSQACLIAAHSKAAYMHLLPCRMAPASMWASALQVGDAWDLLCTYFVPLVGYIVKTQTVSFCTFGHWDRF